MQSGSPPRGPTGPSAPPAFRNYGTFARDFPLVTVLLVGAMLLRFLLSPTLWPLEWAVVSIKSTTPLSIPDFTTLEFFSGNLTAVLESSFAHLGLTHLAATLFGVVRFLPPIELRLGWITAAEVSIVLLLASGLVSVAAYDVLPVGGLGLATGLMGFHLTSPSRCRGSDTIGAKTICAVLALFVALRALAFLEIWEAPVLSYEIPAMLGLALGALQRYTRPVTSIAIAAALSLACGALLLGADHRSPGKTAAAALEADQSGEAQTAISSYRQLFDEPSFSTWARVRAASLLHQAQDYREADEVLKPAYSKDPELVGYTWIHWKLRARSLHEELATIDPADSERFHRLLLEAIHAYRRCIEMYPSDPVALCELGTLLLAGDDASGALRAFNRAHHLDQKITETFPGWWTLFGREALEE